MPRADNALDTVGEQELGKTGFRVHYGRTNCGLLRSQFQLRKKQESHAADEQKALILFWMK
jgi:hypothetical protein